MSTIESSDSLSTSSSLLQRLKENDQDAWRRMVRIYSPLVYYWIRQRASLQAADAAEVMQEVFRSVAGSLSHFKHDGYRGRFRGWLRTIARNAVCEHLRSQSRQSRHFGDSDNAGDLDELAEPQSRRELEDSPEACLIIQEVLETIRGEFAEHHWQAFRRTAIRRESTGEVAESLGMSRDAVRQARCRVRARIAQELREAD